ncbi:aminotransferase class 3 [Grosmannia clavigera kw1407]|uniref:Aminotransferase class 3 n=1 Tax=Grosmannia clavigera (strain kw1407 / UAMH 11150) TaxID=655863 RepID=F0XJH9_GROCL|nr:aminotransferase class 3 [Grosmannia clavigera kw1407]EFX02144.1 aminotransferase class 3 [Grosmannia clavigera kw1407]
MAVVVSAKVLEKASEPAAVQSTEPCLLYRSLIERPSNVEMATGSYLYLDDGRKILDACGGAAVAVLGHGNAEVIGAVMKQMQKVSYVHTLSYGTDSSEELAHAVLHFSDGSFDHGLVKAFFVGSGSEANDAAMKCARQYWYEKGETQRRFYVARKQSYHGNTIGSMSISGMAGRKMPYNEILPTNVSFVSAADAFHGRKADETEAMFVSRLVAELEAEFVRLGPENVISFIGETVSGAALGTLAAPTGYWRSVRNLCDKYGILLHMDEVMCGTGRTGSYFAFEQEGIRPDIVTVGKGLGGGYVPIAGMLVGDRVVDALRHGSATFNHGQTYQAHPVSCAAALAVQTILRRDGLVARVAARAKTLQTLLQAAFAGCVHVADIRGRGFFWSVEFMQDSTSRQPFPRRVNFGPHVQRVAFDKGVAVYPGAGTIDGILGDHVLLAPPYMASDEELRTAVATLREAYDEVVKSLD